MHIVYKFLLFLLLFSVCINAHAQRFDNRGWLYYSGINKLSPHFSLLSEVQLRMADQLNYATATLLRSGINYNITKKHSVGAGFTYKGDREYNNAKDDYDYTNENRLYEQYQLDTKLGKTAFQTRIRLEQRFIRITGERQFSQRSRLLLSLQVPVSANADFSRGWYTILQNEVFVNVQYKNRVNNSVFDQNRLYTSYGYRFNKHIDLEGAYMLWLQKEDELAWRNVYQIKVTTDF